MASLVSDEEETMVVPKLELELEPEPMPKRHRKLSQQFAQRPPQRTSWFMVVAAITVALLTAAFGEPRDIEQRARLKGQATDLLRVLGR